MTFTVGETVVYPNHGAAVIEDIEMRTIKGEEKQYLVLRIVAQQDLVVRVPACNLDLVGVRDVVDKEGLDRVFDVLRAVVPDEGNLGVVERPAQADEVRLPLRPEEHLPPGLPNEVERHVDFIGSYPPGDLSDGLLWGPMREETMTWFNRLTTGISTPHATAADGHRNLLLTMAMDLSARTGRAVPLPIKPQELL